MMITGIALLVASPRITRAIRYLFARVVVAPVATMALICTMSHALVLLGVGDVVAHAVAGMAYVAGAALPALVLFTLIAGALVSCMGAIRFVRAGNPRA